MLELSDDGMIVLGIAREMTSGANEVDVLGCENGTKTLVRRRGLSGEAWEEA